MKRYTTAITFSAVLMCIFWAITIMDSLLHEFADNITWVDLSVLFILGLISGVLLALAFITRRQSPEITTFETR